MKLELNREELRYLKETIEHNLEYAMDDDYIKMLDNLYTKIGLVATHNQGNVEIKKLQDEVSWYRTYGEFINTNHPHVDGEACAYADEVEMKQE
jgi:hypothetical protein